MTNTNIINFDTLKLLINAHQKESPKENHLNYSQLLAIAQSLDENYNKLSLIVQSKLPLTNRSLEDNQLTFLQLDDEFRSISELCLMPRDAALLILKSVVTKPPVPCIKDGPIQPADVPERIKRPPPFRYGNLKFSLGEHRPIAEYRYIFNFDVKQARQAIEHANKVKDIEPGKSGDMNREAALIRFYLDKVINQSRSINIARMCLAQILLMRVRAIKHSWHTCCTDEDNPSIYYLQQLLAPFNRWPFLDTTTGMYYPHAESFSSQIPLLLYSILNRGYSWTLGAVSTSMFNLCMHTYFEWATTSLDDEHLLQKGAMNNVRKLLNERVDKSTILMYSGAGIGGFTDIENPEEFWLRTAESDERKNLIKILDETPTTREYFDYVKIMLLKRFTRDELILLRMGLACVTNNSTFKKSSPTLEYDRSAEHKVHNPITMPSARLVYNGFAVEPRFDPDSQIGRCWKVLQSKRDTINSMLEKRNFENEFWDRLTNNSGGMTSETIITKKSTNPALRSMPSIPYGQRYVTALIDNDVLYNREKALASISERIKAGKREQIDRRSRWIMMVSNTLQVAFSVALTYSRELTKISKYIASGKQTGDVRDMLKVLRATADNNTIITDNDIKGMDSSTQEQIADMILQIVFQALDGLDIPQFFYASKAEVKCERRDLAGRTNGVEMKHLNAVQIFLIDIVGHMRSTSYEFTENVVDVVSYIAGSVFFSGAFHTAGNHNTLQDANLEDFEQIVCNAYQKFQLIISAQALGDDLNVAATFNQRSEAVDNAMTNVISQLQKMLYDLGFITDPESSRSTATFLQQTAVYGGVEPKHARLSLVVAEQPIGRSKDPFGQIKEIGDILDEVSSRSPEPANANAILIANWAVARVISLSKGIDGSQFSRRLSNMQDVNHKYRRWIVAHARGIYLTIPMVAIYLPEVFGAPLPPLWIKGHGLKIPSFFMPKGSFGYWLISRALKKELTADESEALIKANRAKLWKSLDEKVKQGLMTEARADQQRVKDVYVQLTQVIDQELAANLGFSLSQWLFHVLPKTLRLAERDAKNPEFARLVDIGRQKQDQSRAAASYLAQDRLSKHGIFLPKGIAYYNQPENRLVNAFVQKNEQSRRIGLENESIVDAIYAQLHSSSGILFSLPDSSLLDFDIFISGNNYKLSADAQFLQRATFGPCSPIGSDSHTLSLLFGTPFGTPSHDAIVDAMKGELTVGADVELIMEQAAKVSRRNKDLLDDFFTYVGIPYHSFAKVRMFIQDYSTYGLIQYQGVMNKRKHFYSSTHTAAARSLIDLSELQSGGVRWTRLQMMIARDYFHTFPETKTKIRVVPTQALVERLVRH
nr:MAG: RNA-dependent RNA polymerase [brine shrimp reovirus 1]UNI74415.1 MAG: RNA-dependent RNA polymerase [brine shrimp reovirus 1]